MSLMSWGEVKVGVGEASRKRINLLPFEEPLKSPTGMLRACLGLISEKEVPLPQPFLEQAGRLFGEGEGVVENL